MSMPGKGKEASVKNNAAAATHRNVIEPRRCTPAGSSCIPSHIGEGVVSFQPSSLDNPASKGGTGVTGGLRSTESRNLHSWQRDCMHTKKGLGLEQVGLEQRQAFAAQEAACIASRQSTRQPYLVGMLQAWLRTCCERDASLARKAL